MNWLFKLTGWKVFRPSRAPWGEATRLWSDADWRWFRRYQAPLGYLRDRTISGAQSSAASGGKP